MQIAYGVDATEVRSTDEHVFVPEFHAQTLVNDVPSKPEHML